MCKVREPLEIEGYTVFIFQRAHVTTECDKSSWLKVSLTAIPWKNYPSPHGTLPFGYASGVEQ